MSYAWLCWNCGHVHADGRCPETVKHRGKTKPCECIRQQSADDVDLTKHQYEIYKMIKERNLPS